MWKSGTSPVFPGVSSPRDMVGKGERFPHLSGKKGLSTYFPCGFHGKWGKMVSLVWRVFFISVIASQCSHWRGNPFLAPSERGLSPKVTGGENLSLLFSPSVMTCGHDTSLAEGGNKTTTDRPLVGEGFYRSRSVCGGIFGERRADRVVRPYFFTLRSPFCQVCLLDHRWNSGGREAFRFLTCWPKIVKKRLALPVKMGYNVTVYGKHIRLNFINGTARDGGGVILRRGCCAGI